MTLLCRSAGVKSTGFGLHANCILLLSISVIKQAANSTASSSLILTVLAPVEKPRSCLIRCCLLAADFSSVSNFASVSKVLALISSLKPAGHFNAWILPLMN